MHQESNMLKKLAKMAALTAAAGALATPGIATAADKTICFVTFSLQIAYFQSSVCASPP